MDVVNAASASGILFVAAAGNDGANLDSYPIYPGSFNTPNMITVAATDRTDQLASFSNISASLVHIAAPGMSIYSTLPQSPTSDSNYYGLPTSYGFLSGTSMATPHVSGALVVLKAAQPGLSMSQIRSQLLTHTDTLSSLVGKVQNASRLNLYNAVNSNWTPTLKFLEQHVVLDDATEGNGDGFVNPGETVRLTPVYLNASQVTAPSVTISIASADPNVTLLGTNSYVISNVTGVSSVQAPAPFRFSAASSLHDLDYVHVQLTISYGNQVLTIPHDYPVFVPAPHGEQVVPFVPFALVADPSRNVIYVSDITILRFWQ